MTKYFGSFSDHETCGKEWVGYGEKLSAPEGFPTDKQILFAAYDIDGYDGSAFVLYKRGDALYEVHGSHCSCMGLEGQWKPEETTWAALALRPRGSDYGALRMSEVSEAYWKLVDRRVKREEKKNGRHTLRSA